jgi:hypothetical protein
MSLKCWTEMDGMPPNGLYLLELNPEKCWPLTRVRDGYIIRGEKECPVSEYTSRWPIYGPIEV